MIIATSIFCLALAVLKETEGESLKSKEALALMTWNRTLDESDKGNKQASVCSIIEKKGQFTWKQRYHKKYNLSEKVLKQPAWIDSLEVAKRVHAGKLWDFTHGARFVNSRRMGKRFKTPVKPLYIGSLMYY
jgi:hypothetical protein